MYAASYPVHRTHTYMITMDGTTCPPTYLDEGNDGGEFDKYYMEYYKEKKPDKDNENKKKCPPGISEFDAEFGRVDDVSNRDLTFVKDTGCKTDAAETREAIMKQPIMAGLPAEMCDRLCVYWGEIDDMNRSLLARAMRCPTTSSKTLPDMVEEELSMLQGRSSKVDCILPPLPPSMCPAGVEVGYRFLQRFGNDHFDLDGECQSSRKSTTSTGIWNRVTRGPTVD
jgi:hypothetical protein